MATNDLDRVGEYVRARRGEIGLTQQELGAKAGVDTSTISSLELGQTWPWAKNRARIEVALGWKSRSLEEIRRGREPVLAGEPQENPPRYLDPVEQHIADIPGLSEPEKQALIAVARSLRESSRRQTG